MNNYNNNNDNNNNKKNNNQNFIKNSQKNYTSDNSNSGAQAAEGRQAEPHTRIRELKGTHELIFSCVPASGVARGVASIEKKLRLFVVTT